MEPTLASAAAPSHPKPVHPLTYVALAVLTLGTVVFLWQAPSSYEIYKALHVVLAVVWVGGGTAFTIMALLADRARATGEMPTIAKYAMFLGERVFTPAGVLVLGFGIAMVQKGDLGWGVFWIDFALVVWAVSFALGAGILGPTAKKIHEAFAESRGELTPQIERLIDRIILIARFDVVLLLLIVVDMTAKPSF
jgi:uncharacterized membrane protein